MEIYRIECPEGCVVLLPALWRSARPPESVTEAYGILHLPRKRAETSTPAATNQRCSRRNEGKSGDLPMM